MAAAYATSSDVTSEYPALAAAATSDQLTSAVAWAQTQVDLGLWGVKASFFHRDLAAHCLAMHPEVSAAGASPPVTGRTFGGLSTTYAAPVMSDEWLQLTVYGQRAKALRDTLFVAPTVAQPAAGLGSWGDPPW